MSSSNLKIQMLETLPFEIQLEIFKRLPAKTLIQLRSVSKSWRSLIDSPRFITSYSAQQQHLLLSNASFGKSYLLISDDDDTFPERRPVLTPPLFLNSTYEEYDVIGSSRGLLCLHCYCQAGHCLHKGISGMFVLWNLSIRKAVAVVQPDAYSDAYSTVTGFGVCRETSDPKIVIVNVSHHVDIFTLSTGVWKRSYNNLPRKSIRFVSGYVDVDGFPYWLATDRIAVDGELRSYSLLILFDMTTEEFREVSLPDYLASVQEKQTNHSLRIYNLRNSLAVLDRCVYGDYRVWDVWMMEDGVSKSFTKMFTFNVSLPDAYLMGFRKSGAPIVEIVEDCIAHFVVFEPNSKHSDNVWTEMMYNTVAMYPYMETLLLLDQPDLMVYT